MCAVLLVILAVGGLSVPSQAAAQTIRPIVVEYRGRAEGRFELVNNTLFPVNVVLEAHSFDMDADGEMIFRPLDPDVKLELSAMSVRIPAGQSRFVFYRASSASAPDWFTVYANFRGYPSSNGMDVQIELPHTVFLYGDEPAHGGVELVSVREATGDALLVTVRNSSNRLNRIGRGEVGGRDGKREVPGFALLPGQSRTLTLPSAALAEYVRLEGDSFRLEHRLKPAS